MASSEDKPDIASKGPKGEEKSSVNGISATVSRDAPPNGDASTPQRSKSAEPAGTGDSHALVEKTAPKSKAVAAKPAAKVTAKAAAKAPAAARAKRGAEEAAPTGTKAATASGRTTAKPAAAEVAKPRPQPGRARAAGRADTRTTTRKTPATRKSAAPEVEVETILRAAGPVPADAGRPPAKAEAPQTSAPQPKSPKSEARAQTHAPDQPSRDQQGRDSAAGPTLIGTTTAFMEAAFGPNSHLPEQLVVNIERIEALTQRLLKALAQRKPSNPGVEGPGAEFYASATAAWLKLLAEQPARVLGQQVSYWGDTLRHFAETQAAFSKGQFAPPEEEGPRDRRFSNPLWDDHPFFSFIKRQYQINAKALQQAASDLEIDDTTERRRIEWFTRQIIDMMAPTNFLATNPDALEKAVATEGESLVQGLENLVRDVEQNSGELIVSLADRDAFRVGENIGTTAGTVVARSHLYELIQYKPSTPQTYRIPLVIFPPWINKFYILDLKPQNSLVKWIVDQGYTLFVVAWKNPDVSYAETGMDDYVSAYLEVMDRIQDLTGEEKVNAIGYCIAGTTLALTLALLKQRGDERVNSATFFTTLTDFAEQGEFTTYLQDDFVDGIEEEVNRHGLLSSQLMTRTFSFLRANDLVWAPAIRSYMLGEAPPAFDLLYWNGDGTNLPGRMAIEYLRGLCQQNAFARDGYTVHGRTVRLSEVSLPLCAIACETDHIAPWRDSWRGVAQMGSKDRTFILSESGHIAGIVNPPSKKKYGHYTSAAGFAGDSQSWRDAATFHEGSWWANWSAWLAPHSGDLIEARDPGEGFGPAPGDFVHERP